MVGVSASLLQAIDGVMSQASIYRRVHECVKILTTVASFSFYQLDIDQSFHHDLLSLDEKHHVQLNAPPR